MENQTPQNPVYDVVNKAKHYNEHPSGIEAIVLVRCLNFNMGGTLKYVIRRHGKEYERSLKSAGYYLDDQHKHHNLIMVNMLEFSQNMPVFIKHEPEPLVFDFYQLFLEYCMQPVDARFTPLRYSLEQILDAGV